MNIFYLYWKGLVLAIVMRVTVMENYKEKKKNILHHRNTNNSQRLNDSKQIKYCAVVSQRNENKTSKNTRKAKQTKLRSKRTVVKKLYIKSAKKFVVV